MVIHNPAPKANVNSELLELTLPPPIVTPPTTIAGDSTSAENI